MPKASLLSASNMSEKIVNDLKGLIRGFIILFTTPINWEKDSMLMWHIPVLLPSILMIAGLQFSKESKPDL